LKVNFNQQTKEISRPEHKHKQKWSMSPKQEEPRMDGLAKVADAGNMEEPGAAETLLTIYAQAKHSKHMHKSGTPGQGSEVEYSANGS